MSPNFYGAIGVIIGVCLVLLLSECADAQTTAILVDEYISGTNRICIYDDVDGRVAITIKDYQVCPYTLRN